MVCLMRLHEVTLFTVAEAAVLTGLSLKAIHNVIDKKTVPTVRADDGAGGKTARLVDFRALLCLALERRLADRFVPQARREIFDAVVKARGPVILDEGLLKIDLKGLRQNLAISLRGLRRARQLVISDPEIMGGEPVFRGTRIPVHLIASLLEQGASGSDLQEGYPRLTLEMIGVAPLYASAYPPRGRPVQQPWHGQRPTHYVRKLAVRGAA